MEGGVCEEVVGGDGGVVDGGDIEEVVDLSFWLAVGKIWDGGCILAYAFL